MLSICTVNKSVLSVGHSRVKLHYALLRICRILEHTSHPVVFATLCKRAPFKKEHNFDMTLYDDSDSWVIDDSVDGKTAFFNNEIVNLLIQVEIVRKQI